MSESGAIARLRAAMAPDPSRWRYTGISRDAGGYGRSRCACGHPVRYEFVIERDDGKRLAIGSHCIKTNVPYLISVGAERLARDLEAAERAFQRERAAERRESIAGEALPALHRDVAALRDWWSREQRRALLLRGTSLDELSASFAQLEGLPDPSDSANQTANAIRRRYLVIWWAGAQAARVREGVILPPVPAERRLLAQLRTAIRRNLADPESRWHETAIFATGGRLGAAGSI